MKIFSTIIAVGFCVAVISCNGKRRTPGRIYMPDMTYSRAYETYADHSNLAKSGVFYNNMPVAGTIARGEELPFLIPKDSPGDTANYVSSKQVINPIPFASEDSVQKKEAERLYLINCAICHGAKLNGNGPLYKDGNGPYPAAPANFVGLSKYQTMPEGQMFYSVEYGKNLMGSYASQLSRAQRWMIINYIKSKEDEAVAAAAKASTDSTSNTGTK